MDFDLDVCIVTNLMSMKNNSMYAFSNSGNKYKYLVQMDAHVLRDEQKKNKKKKKPIECCQSG